MNRKMRLEADLAYRNRPLWDKVTGRAPLTGFDPVRTGDAGGGGGGGAGGSGAANAKANHASVPASVSSSRGGVRDYFDDGEEEGDYESVSLVIMNEGEADDAPPKEYKHSHRHSKKPSDGKKKTKQQAVRDEMEMLGA
jgi:hypothetical protein